MKQSIRVFAISMMAMFFIAENASAQKDKSTRPSPPAQATAKIGDATVTIDYSQPSKKGREVFGGIVPYGEVWRTGANEAAWIEVSADVTIGGKTLSKGKYGLFTVPGEKEWEVIFNKTWDQWGAYNYSKADDVLRIKAKASTTDATEQFTISISDGGTVTMAWDTTKAEFQIK
ncbi:MAG: DUF2911 domain-containing protein [Cyclobacteriaceae bacterium]